jgi:hypothetical protein
VSAHEGGAASTTSTTEASTTSSTAVRASGGADTATTVRPGGGGQATTTTAPPAPDAGEDPQFIRAFGDGFGVRMGKPQAAKDDETAAFGFEAYWRPTEPLDAVDIDFGDGTVHHFDAPCDDPDNAVYEPVEHSYVDPGTYEVRLTASTGPRCRDGAPVQRASGVGHVAVGDVVTNGPSEPSARVDQSHRNEDGTTTFTVTVVDDDGWVGDVWVLFQDPSDGHHELWPYTECEIGAPRSFDVTHDFSGEPADVRVQLTSTGCDGEHRQEATRNVTVPVS